MKVEKNNLVFSAVLFCILIFILSYAMLVLKGDEEPTLENNQTPVPELGDVQKEYKSKLDALDDLKEVRRTNAPSIYDESLLDSMGVYDPDLLEKKKMRIIDSIYNEGRIDYTDASYKRPKTARAIEPVPKDTINVEKEFEIGIPTKELALEHQLFFASDPTGNREPDSHSTDEKIYVRVDGTQVVRQDFRLQMRLVEEALIDNVRFPRNTIIYGFVSFKPNRTIIAIGNIKHRPVKLRAFDLQDGNEGIYIENSFRAEARREVVGDVVDDINIVGVPQVSGIKRIFQQDNRRVRATIHDNYRLILRTATTKN